MRSINFLIIKLRKKCIHRNAKLLLFTFTTVNTQLFHVQKIVNIIINFLYLFLQF